MFSEFPIYGFKLEYFDERAELIRPYVLTYRTERDEIEIFDTKNRRPFLRRTVEHSVRLKDLVPGGLLTLNGRQYTIVDYADENTRRAFSDMMQRTLLLIKPQFSQRLGETLDRIYQAGLFVMQLRMGMLARDAAALVCSDSSDPAGAVQFATSGPVIAMEIVGQNSVSKVQEMVGSASDVARRESPTLRGQFGRSATEDFAHASGSVDAAIKELDAVFGNRSVRLVSSLDRTSLLVIKPHAMKAGVAGKIVKQLVDNGFFILGAMIASLDLEQAAEFYDVYRGVVDEFTDMTKELSSGLCLAIEVAKDDGDVVQDLRALCGPRDVPIAKAIEPASIRAKYGVDLVKNAVHCTDLPDDTYLECEYFFKLLDQ